MDELDVLFDESNIIEDYNRKQANLKELKAQWKAVADKFVTGVWIKRYINEQQKQMLEKYYANLVDDDVTYSNYKKAFNFIAKFMGLPSKTIIIEDLQFKNDNKDKEQMIVALRYSKGQAKVTIPEGVSLIHICPADGETELRPSFRSKKKGRFMYPSLRVFFTVAKDIKPKKAGLSDTNKLYRYRTVKDMHEAYIDPTYNKFEDGSVYIETDTPIPVERYDKWLEKFFAKMEEKFKFWQKKEPPKAVTNEAAMNVFDDFMGKIKGWKTSNEAHKHQVFRSTSVSDEDFEKLQEYVKIMKTTEEYTEYKKAFDAFCKFCHIVPRGTILCKYNLEKGKVENKNSIYVEYSYNTKKVDIPDDLDLYHNTKVEGITELKPFFRSKVFTKGGETRRYLYDKPRIYLTVNKYLPKFLADYKASDTLHKYRAKTKIKQAYVDPLVWAGIQGALYIETTKPLSVEEVLPKSFSEKIGWAKKDEDKEEPKNEALINFGCEFNLWPELISEEFSMDNEILFINESFIDDICYNKSKAKKDLMAAVNSGNCSKKSAEHWAYVIRAYEKDDGFKKFLNAKRSQLAKIDPDSKESYYKKLFSIQGASLAFIAKAYKNSNKPSNRVINGQLGIQSQITQQQLMIQQQQMDQLNQMQIQQNIQNIQQQQIDIINQQNAYITSQPMAFGGMLPNSAFGMM